MFLQLTRGYLKGRTIAACGVLLAVLLLVGLPSLAATPVSVEDAMTVLAATPAESEPEERAMSAVIAIVRRNGAPIAPADAAAHAAQAQDLEHAAHTPADYAAAASVLNSAARAAPWVADYQFALGELLVKAENYAAAERAFSLYLEAAPAAKDRDTVRKLIAGLRREHPVAEAEAPVPVVQRKPGEVFRDCPHCPDMVVLAPGRFLMGSPAGEQGRFDSEGPQHPVTVRPFALGKYDVTEEEYATFLAETGYQPAPCNRILDKSWRTLPHGVVFPPGMADLPRQPAICVSWNDAQTYIAWLNKKLGAPANVNPYRLPSEAEWEYAARAGTTTARWWGEQIGSANANCHGCGSRWDNTLIAPVGSFGPNGFGLYDMLGNAWQWLADCWNESYAGAPSDGSAWTAGDCGKRAMRGGSWSNIPAFIRSAARSRGNIDGADFDYSSYVGFRLAKGLP